jgi:hypothetical protein
MTGSFGSTDQDNAIIWCMRLSEGAQTARARSSCS